MIHLFCYRSRKDHWMRDSSGADGGVGRGTHAELGKVSTWCVPGVPPSISHPNKWCNVWMAACLKCDVWCFKTAKSLYFHVSTVVLLNKLGDTTASFTCQPHIGLRHRSPTPCMDQVRITICRNRLSASDIRGYRVQSCELAVSWLWEIRKHSKYKSCGKFHCLLTIFRYNYNPNTSLDLNVRPTIQA